MIFQTLQKQVFSHGMLITLTMTDSFDIQVKNLHVAGGGTSYVQVSGWLIWNHDKQSLS